MAIAYGGEISSRGTKVYRYANRIPLLYDEGSDVVLKVVNEMDLKRYKVGNDPPLVIISHICSTRIPYKTVGKENVADRQEIEREIRLALQFLLRKLASYMQKRGRADEKNSLTPFSRGFSPRGARQLDPEPKSRCISAAHRSILLVLDLSWFQAFFRV